MKMVRSRTGSVPAWAAAIVLVLVVATSKLRADEPHCQCPVAAAEKCLPLLTRLPYVGRLFRTAGANAECCEDEFERIGVDFDFATGEQGPKLIFGIGYANAGAQCTCEDCKCPAGTCPANCNAANAAANKTACHNTNVNNGKCVCTNCNCPEGACPEACAAHVAHSHCCAVQTAEGCAAGKCCIIRVHAEEACPNTSAANCTAECAEHCVAGKCCPCPVGARVLRLPAPDRLLDVSRLSAENIRLASQLEAQESIFEERTELLDAIAELAGDKAKLEACLEFQAQHAQLVKEMHELYAENLQLKAQANLATERENLLRDGLKTALENERLKLQVAELERRLVESEVARTAKKSNTDSTQKPR